MTPLDIEMFGFLYPLCDHAKLTRLERNHMEFTELKAYGAAIENIRLYGRAGVSFIPFSCPDGLVGAVSDFLLSLDEVDVAVVCSQRQDEIRISVRSEIQEVHAGYLIRRALKGIGDGGGHACMAGGLISGKDLPKLGNFPEDTISHLFLEALADMSQTL